MRTEDDGVTLRSRPMTWGVGVNLPVDVSFLSECLSWEAPELIEWAFVLEGSVTAGGGGSALGRDAAKLFDNIRIKAAGNALVEASGAALRVNEQEEGDATQVDPADIVAAATNASYRYELVIPYELSRIPDAHKRDFRPSVAALLACGLSIDIKCATARPTNYSAETLTVTVLAKVREGRQKQVNSLLTLVEYGALLAEDNVTIAGSLRGLTLTSKLTTTGYTSMASLVAIDSKTLDYPSGFNPAALRGQYRRQRAAPSTTDENLLATPGAVPWVFADRNQRIPSMLDLKTCHVKMNVAVPASAVWLVSSIQDRHPRYSAAAAGYNNVDQFLADMAARGVVRDGKNTPVSQWDPRLVTRMPLRIKG